MIVSPDKEALQQRFSHAAPVYDDWAAPQRRIARRLCDVLPDGPEPRRILDLGCGTGILSRLLRAKYPQARICAVDLAPGMIRQCRARWTDSPPADFRVGDAEALDVDGPFDLIASSCSFQWFGARDAAARNIRAALAPAGTAAVAVPIEGTLCELAESYRSATGDALPALDLWDEPRYRALFEQAGLPARTVVVETVRVYHDHPIELLRALRGIGATFTPGAGVLPLSASRTRALLDAYRERFREADGRVPCTYRVLYAVVSPNLQGENA